MTFDGSQLSVTGTVVTNGFALPNIDTSLGELTTATPMTTSKSIDWLNRETYNASSLATIDWENRTLSDSNPIRSVDWETKYLNAYDTGISGSTLSVDWNGRSLYSFRALPMPTSVLSLDWNFRELYDVGGTISLAWKNRNLFTTNGTNVGLSWADDTILTSDVYQRDYKSVTTQDAVSTNYNNPYASYLGDIIEVDGISTTIGITVTDGMLVNLDSGNWTPVNQANGRATRLLGIAHNVGFLGLGTGYVLLEGHVVIDDASTSGPYVASAGYGLPIYIEDSTTTGTMSTVVPTTTGGPNIVRVLGHCYQQNSGTSTQWMMKFRPSNDWIEI
jgi:hypothetical protein